MIIKKSTGTQWRQVSGWKWREVTVCIRVDKEWAEWGKGGGRWERVEGTEERIKMGGWRGQKGG